MTLSDSGPVNFGSNKCWVLCAPCAQESWGVWCPALPRCAQGAADADRSPELELVCEGFGPTCGSQR
jgi:hypothetical protein